MHLTHLKYRADIDGLRAIAVLFVVGFHAFPHWIEGGFIGVDIFFVISGFLISTIIIGSLERNRFSFIEFYGRRIKRIFPALLLVLIASLVFGWFALLAAEYKQLGKHIAGGAGFVSNFLLWNESGYFDNAAETKPLLHLWSLGIEEQFYIVWPFLLWAAWRQRFNLLVVTFVVAGISFSFNVIEVRGDAVSAFYSPQTRFWELLAGSILAYVGQHRPRAFPSFAVWFDSRFSQTFLLQFLPKNGKVLRDVQSAFGLALIGIGVFVVTKEANFPGWWAILPVSGALLIISAGTQAWINRAVLSNRVLVWFGLISFPLYLWHWPLLSFARIVEGGMPSQEMRGAAVLLSIALAWLTYRFIEKPIRFGRYSKEKTVVLIVLMAAVGFIGYGCYQKDGLKSRASIKRAEIISDAVDDWKYPQGLIPQLNDGIKTYNISQQPPFILFFGDSHIEQFGPKVVDLNSKYVIPPTMFFSGGGCLPIPNVFEDKHPYCQDHIQKFQGIIKNNKTIHTVVIGGCWNCYFSRRVGEQSSKDHLYDYYFLQDGSKKISLADENGKRLALRSLKEFLINLSFKYKVYLILDNPQGRGFDPREMLGKRRWIFGTFAWPEQRLQIPQDQIQLNDELRSIGTEAGVRVINQASSLCVENACIRINQDGRPVYKDDNHLRPYFVIDKSSYIDQIFRAD